MRILMALTLSFAAAGCSSVREAGVLTVSVTEIDGKPASNSNFAVMHPNGKVAWSEVPASGATVSGALHGGDFTILVLTAKGAAAQEFTMDGDTKITVKAGQGGSVRGEARANAKPIAARVWMPIPGKTDSPLDRLSHVVRSNADGRFQIDRLPPGKWTLYIGNEGTGYKPVVVKIKEKETTDIGIVETVQ